MIQGIQKKLQEMNIDPNQNSDLNEMELKVDESAYFAARKTLHGNSVLQPSPLPGEQSPRNWATELSME